MYELTNDEIIKEYRSEIQYLTNRMLSTPIITDSNDLNVTIDSVQCLIWDIKAIASAAETLIEHINKSTVELLKA